jgi:DAACS family dicarboxylate/amino acid:cation (Na+ or H+) symporter
MTTDSKILKAPLYKRILISMISGCLLGLLLHFLLPGDSVEAKTFQTFLEIIGQVFLSLLFVMVVPLITSALILSSFKLCQRSDMSSIAMTIVVRASLLALSASTLALLSSYSMPDLKLNETIKIKLQEYALNSPVSNSLHRLSWNSLVPKNPFHALSNAFEGGSMIPVMIFSVLFGFSLARSKSSVHLLAVLEEVQSACFSWIHWVMNYLAPLAVFCLMASSMQRLGYELLSILSSYIALVLIGLAIQQFIVYSLFLKFAAGIPIRTFFIKIRTVMLTAFSTSSSSATLPISLDAAQNNLQLDPDISRIILTFGATANQNGSALYEGITILFLCKLFSVSLSFLDHLFVLFMCIVASFGTAGVPGGTLPMMASILSSLGVPASSLLLVLGVDRLLDMARTTVNVTGDLVLAQWIDALRKKKKISHHS